MLSLHKFPTVQAPQKYLFDIEATTSNERRVKSKITKYWRWISSSTRNFRVSIENKKNKNYFYRWPKLVGLFHVLLEGGEEREKKRLLNFNARSSWSKSRVHSINCLAFVVAWARTRVPSVTCCWLFAGFCGKWKLKIVFFFSVILCWNWNYISERTKEQMRKLMNQRRNDLMVRCHVLHVKVCHCEFFSSFSMTRTRLD